MPCQLGARLGQTRLLPPPPPPLSMAAVSGYRVTVIIARVEVQ